MSERQSTSALDETFFVEDNTSWGENHFFWQYFAFLRQEIPKIQKWRFFWEKNPYPIYVDLFNLFGESHLKIFVKLFLIILIFEQNCFLTFPNWDTCSMWWMKWIPMFFHVKVKLSKRDKLSFFRRKTQSFLRQHIVQFKDKLWNRS